MATPMLLYGRKHQTGLNWITAIAMTGFHVGAVAALFYVDAGAMLAAFILYYAGGMLGIGMGYHRLLTHRGYKTPKWVEYFLTFCGTLALEGGPIFWVATHRIHHQKSDQEGDPHTPREGTWWAHMGWILLGDGLHHDASVLARYVPDLSRDRGPRLALDSGTGSATSSSASVSWPSAASHTSSGASSSARLSVSTPPGS